ncbi:ATP-dependent zinc metalloprotease FtsH [Nannocystis sp.]|uniref:ATP-dependent zinc metalloprotease FtsH n=1 Tax=Nannocystis sp. TaxID=1962667 RepID=UPI0025E76CBA|nr:ATP-dependent zinc metalloprotease FtsH [Nannocystis sp.]MBK7830707.1 ATP-dependent zinc metalloprotease FtsH [Nannocystis sp.]
MIEPRETDATPTRRAPQASPRRRQPWWVLMLFALAGNYLLLRACSGPEDAITIPYTVFKEQIQADNVVSVTGAGDAIRGQLKAELRYPPDAGGDRSWFEIGGRAHTSKQFQTRRPSFADPGLEALLAARGVVIEATDEHESSWFGVLIGFGPTLLLIGAFVWLSRRAAEAGSGGVFGLGKSRARRYSETEKKVSFADVAGIDEAKAELVEIVDFLKHPQKYQRLGGMMPKGVLLVGAPGTGKTLLARAIAGEAGVPFLSLSASEFIEMIVGVGAARVRDLFKEARQVAPSIIFIDELDAIGRSRGSGAALGGHDEREQTLNQILTEMDGFDSREGIVVLAATNRPDVLDAALLRPGRFDRRIVVQHPDRPGRAAILKVHTRNVPLAPEVSLERLAAETPGLVGADLRNLVNEAALLAARQGAAAVGPEHFAEAIQKITLGPVRHVLLNPADRERTAYHEAGHALLALLVAGSDPVHRVSIVPRGMALGATYQMPSDDRSSHGEDYLRARITGALGGRAAEQLIYGVVTTGAENDLQQVTEIARRMVLRWGMSAKLGPISFVAAADEGLPPAFQHQPYSEATSELIDSEVRRIVEECHAEADRLLAEHRPKLESLARALLEHESLDEQEVRAAAGLGARVA